MTKKSKKLLIIDELTRTPNISLACAKVGISRQTFYRWMGDPEFRHYAKIAIEYGEGYLNDMAEAGLLKKMKAGHWQAIKYRLDKKSSKYMFAVPTSSYPTPRRIQESDELWDYLGNSAD